MVYGSKTHEVCFWMTCLPLPVSGVLCSVLEAAVEGCNVLTLCELGDRLILEETGKVYKKEKEMKKGLYTTKYWFFPVTHNISHAQLNHAVQVLRSLRVSLSTTVCVTSVPSSLTLPSALLLETSSRCMECLLHSYTVSLPSFVSAAQVSYCSSSQRIIHFRPSLSRSFAITL